MCKKDMCRTVFEQKRVKPIEQQDSKNCSDVQSVEVRNIVSEMVIGLQMPKEKKKCKICGGVNWNNVRHFHVECSQCHGKGYMEKGYY